MIKLLEQLFCKHTYEEWISSIHLIDGGRDAKRIFICKKCGKRKLRWNK